MVCVHSYIMLCLGGVTSVSGLLVYKIDTIRAYRKVSDVLNSILKHIV